MQAIYKTMYIYKVYNLLSRDYKTIYKKRSLLTIKIALRILGKSILTGDFNLHYSI